jgi:hypothetical protein
MNTITGHFQHYFLVAVSFSFFDESWMLKSDHTMDTRKTLGRICLLFGQSILQIKLKPAGKNWFFIRKGCICYFVIAFNHTIIISFLSLVFSLSSLLLFFVGGVGFRYLRSNAARVAARMGVTRE